MKKLFSRSLLVFLLSLCSMVGYAQKKVLCEDFGSTALPTGWTSSGNGWQFRDSEALFNAKTENGTDTLITPLVSVADLKNTPTVTIDYRLKGSGSKIDQLSLLYRTATTEAWKPLAQFSEKQDTVTRVYTQLPTDVTGNVQIAVAVVYKDGTATAIGYLAIENQREEVNAPADFRNDSPTATNVTLRWARSYSDYFLQSNLKVSTTPITDFSVKADVFDGNVRTDYTTIKNLNANTQYYAYVRYECEDNDYSPWAELQFKTPCASVIPPYTENFEDGLTDCYTIIRNSRRAEVSEAYPHNGAKAFQFLTNRSDYNYLFFPALEVDNMQDYQISFYVASEVTGRSYGREITVGFAKSATEENFQEWKTVSLPQGRQWERVTISFAGFKGDGKVVALRAGNTDAENHIFIDDVTIERAEACPRPMFVTVSNVTYNSARLSWTEAGNATEWNVVIATKPYAAPNDCEPDAAKGEYAGSATTNPYEVTNLQPQTTYYAYVQSECAEDEWTEVASFTTGKQVTIPYKEGFDRFDPDFYTDNYTAVPDQWVTGSRGLAKDLTHNYDKEDDADQAAHVTASYVDHTNSAYVPGALLLTCDYSNTGYYWTSYAMMPAMPKDVNKLLLSFYAYSYGELTRLIVGVADVQSNEIEQGKQLKSGGNVTPVDTLSFTELKAWEKFTLNMGKYAGKGRYITFYTEPGSDGKEIDRNKYGSDVSGVFIDDITIEDAPTCFAVQNLAAVPISTASFKATWTETLNATSWKIKVSTTEIDPATTDGDIVKNATVNTTPEYVANNLKPNTTYYVYVTPACDNLWKSTQVTTIYALTVPYYNDFSDEATGNGKAPKYWTNGNWAKAVATTNSYRPSVNTTSWSSGDGEKYPIPSEVKTPSLKLYAEYKSTSSTARASQPYVALPELTGADVKDVTLSFWAWSSCNTYTTVKDPVTGKNVRVYSTTGYDLNLKIGVMTDIADKSTLTEVTTVSVIGDTIKQPLYFFVDMSSYQGMGKYIVLYMDNQATKTSDIYIDNFSINLSSTPKRVSNLQVIDSTVTETSAKLKWHENGDAKQWKIRLFTEEQTNPTGATPVKEFTASDSSFTVTGLTHSTQYFAYVQAVKGTEGGVWSMACPFWTETGTWTIPFYEDFNSYPTGGTSKNTLPNYYDLTGSVNYPYVYGTSSSEGGDAEKKYLNGLRFTTGSAAKYSQIIFPKFDKPINTLQLTMDVNCYNSSTSYVHVTYVGVVTDDGQFHKVAEHVLSNTKAWEECFVDFSSYTGEDGRIAIRHDYDMTGLKKTTDTYVDNISIVAIPDCKRISSIRTDKVEATSATVLWTKAGEETAWNLKVSTTPLSSPSDATADVFDGQVTSVTKALTNLEPNTTYYVYVQTVRADKNCVGEWSLGMSFTTLCLPMALPYTEDFEGFVAEKVPDCFTLSGDVKDATAACAKPLGWDQENMTLYLSQTDTEKKNYCAFPLLDCKDASELQLRMFVMPSSTGNTTDPINKCSRYFYEVGVMTDPNDPTTYVAMYTDSVIADGTKIGKDKFYSFAKYAGDEMGKKGKYIAIKVLPYKKSSNAEYAGSIYIDNVKIERVASCTPPTEVRVVEFDNDTVALTWNATDKTGNFRIRIFDAANANPDVDTPVKDVVVKDTTSAVVKDLNGNTVYYVFVRKECSATNVSTWSHYTMWHSDCEELQTMPYVETFEGCVQSEIPNCWSQIMQTFRPPYGGGTQKITISVASGAAKDSKLGLQITYNSSGSTGKKAASAVTPRLNITSFKDVVLYFDAKTNSSKTGLKIEAVESPSPDAAAIEITTIEGIDNTGWKTCYIDLADYYTSAQEYQYLRFTPTNYTIYMDNIHITTNKSEIIPVQTLRLQSLTETSATFSFSEVTPSVKQWMVEYGPKGFALGAGTKQIVDTTVVTLQGLTANTTYDIYVRANVQGAVKYAGPLTVTTTKQTASLPYYYGFEDANENANLWSIITTNIKGEPSVNQFAFGDAVQVGGTGKTSLYIQHDGICGYATNDADPHSYGYAVRYINIPAKGTYTIGMRAKNYGNMEESRDDQDFFAVSLAPATVTPSTDDLIRTDGSTGSPVTTKADRNEFNVISKVYREPDYKEFAGNAVITEPGVYQLLLYWQNYCYGVAGPAPAIDSVWVEEYECSEPADHKLVAVTDSSATLTWFAGSNDKFEIIVSRYAKSSRPEEFDAVDVIAHETYVGEPTYTVKGLKPNTSYAIYQRTICSDHATVWHEVDFVTNCVTQTLPYTELFAETPMCWNLSAGVKASTEDYRSDEMEEAGEPAEEWNCLEMPMGSYVVLPDFGVPANRLAVQMNVFNDYLGNATYEIGVVTSPYDMESFKSIQTINTQYKPKTSSTAGNPYIVENYTAMLHRYQGTGRYIVIKVGSAVGGYIKDLTVTLLPECVAPQMVEAAKVTETTATLSWMAGNETEWEVALNADTFTVYENPYLLKNLKNGTDYTVSLRAHCDATHASEWTVPVKFTTKCGVNSLPLIEKFEGLASSKDDDVLLPLNCWSQKYTAITLDSMMHKPNNKAFTDVNSLSNKYMKWVIPYQSVFDRYYNGVPHLRSDVWVDINNSSMRYNYKWLFSPKYKIEDNTTFSFDVAVANLVGKRTFVVKTDTITADMVNLNIAVTKDGIHFTKVKTINLSEQLDSAFHTVQVDLSKFKGDTLSLVFNHGMKYSQYYYSYPSIRINNMRMNCMEVKNISATCIDGCGDYEGHGFTIAESELPTLGNSKTYTRSEVAAEGCDTEYRLTLTSVESPSVKKRVDARICEGDYFEFGDHRIYEAAPNGQPWRLSAPISSSSCDSVIYLYLTVDPMLPEISKTVVLTEAQLPWTDPDNAGYTVPVGATGTFEEVARVINTCRDCRYHVTVNPCQTVRTESSATICQGESVMFNGEPVAPAKDTTCVAILKQVNKCDSIVTMRIKVNPVYHQDINVVLCEGESYQFADTTLTKEGNCTRTFQTVAGCDSIVTVHVTVNPVLHTKLTESICQGQSFRCAGEDFTESNVYERTITSLVTGCDSVITLNLTVTPAPVVQQTATFCEGSTYDFNSTLLNKAGIYSDTTYAENGCMSITELTLSMNPVKRTSLGTEYINKGETYEFFGQALTATGSYSHTLQSAVTGCDSIVTVNLIVLTETTGHESMTVCANELPIVWKGQTITAEGVHQFDTLTTVGTDSTVLLSLHVIDPVNADIRESVCEGGKYQFGDTTLTTAGTYTRTIPSLVTGCDSVITLFLTITPAVVTHMEASICEGDTYDFNGTLLNQAGIYRDTTYAEDTHCMSITELHLVTIKPVRSTINESVCEGGKYQFGDTTLTTAGTYTRTIPSLVTGCDSVISLVLTITPAVVTPVKASICEGGSYDFNGTLLNQPGIYRDTVRNEEDGCMSITELRLIVNKPVHSTISEFVCEGGEYQFGDTTLTTAGTYTRTIPSLVTGCDSIITLALNVTPAERFSTTASFCEGSEYDFYGHQLTEPGVYVDTVKANGCIQQIITLTLTENKPVSSTIDRTICEGGKYQFVDTTLTTAGTYYRTIPSLVTRCDSVITLNLTVTPAPVESLVETICEGAAYDLNGKLLTAAGTYRDTTYADGGCMSITELTLSVTPAPVENKTAEICEDSYFDFAGKQLNTAGTYRDTIYAAETHCMSITELILTVNEIATINVDTTIHIEELPFIYKVDNAGYMILPDTTVEGTYEMDTILVPGSCTSYHFHITVKTTDAVDNIGVSSLHIYPTLINKGQSVNLILDVAPVANNVVVEIHDMVGQLVATYRPASSHVILGDFHTAGMYFVRVLTDDTVSGVGRVVVK